MTEKNKTALRRGKFRVVLVPPLHADGMLPLAAGLLKICAMSDPLLKKKAEIIVLEPWVNAEEAPDRVVSLKPDLVGFTVYGGLEATKTAAAEIRRRCGAKIIFGGPLVSVVSTEELYAGGAVDFSATGEAEKTFPEFLKALIFSGDLSGVKGLSFRSGDRLVVNQRRAPCAELSSLPSPYLENCFNWPDYTKIPLEMTRGCREACLYCSIPRNFRSFGLKRVKADLKKILKDFRKLKTLFLTDSDICQNREIKPLLKLLAGETAGRGANVEVQVNLLNLDERLVGLLNSRVFSIGIGVQSIFPDTCRQVNRRMDLAALSRKAALISVKAPRAKVVMSFIIGLPGDTFERSLANFNWGLSRNLGLYFHRLHVYPGSPLGKAADRRRIRFLDTEPYYVLSTPSMGARAMKKTAAFARKLSLGANIVHADKYFGFLFRYIAGGRAGQSRFPGVDLCRRVSDMARAHPQMAAVIAELSATPDDGDWSGLEANSFERSRIGLIRGLAGQEKGASVRRSFAERYADFCEARLQWESVEAPSACDIIRLALGARLGGRVLLVCGAASSDPQKMQDFSPALEVLIEEKLGFSRTAGGGRRVYADRPKMAAGIRAALRGRNKFSEIIVSQVLSVMPGRERASVLEGLHAASGEGGRLVVIDSGLGYPEFGAEWELTGGWNDCAFEELQAGLAAAGWKNSRTVGLGKWRIIRADRA
ncbi:MAG: hypothetical protein AUJ51_07245 [Elusimicrobia bacterium CG1_02_56_21]|nr:MAG: hypothetical protein AUJ51_07245 [Elusimicrobia bacterium CG1_02_56_21]